ncbi:hypothetical protein CTAYLR_006251 [Chrysophaeum taylorii]|uniref:TauD/TfdA-like domain-containing protein n=1 Tax=Chrysophaeum taylorii TaxID=2483200 RepID=A0AAD7XNZ6_9STRA|nr:hypothetical protein CTAYLR_006251 [Chrysophaeum taylorii]
MLLVVLVVVAAHKLVVDQGGLLVRSVPPAGSPVKVRGRKNLPSGNSSRLPSTIFSPRGDFPLVLEATNPAVTDPTRSLAAYAVAARTALDAALDIHGAVVFRGLPLSRSEDLGRFVSLLGLKSVFLEGGGTARSVVARGVRSASDEPADHTIEPHQDMAHNPLFPSKLAFMMLRGPPPGAGGETVLTNMRAVTRDMVAAGIVAAFERRGGVRYDKRLWSRNAAPNSTFTWQRRFFTDSKREVDAALQRLPTDRGPTTWEWGPRDTLDFHTVLPPCTTHNRTGDTLFFNGIHTNHRDYFDLAPHIDTSLGPPYDTSFADGTPIPGDMLAEIRGSWWKNSVALTLETGDVAILDNLIAGHGRLGWTPGVPRQMLISHLL